MICLQSQYIHHHRLISSFFAVIRLHSMDELIDFISKNCVKFFHWWNMHIAHPILWSSHKKSSSFRGSLPTLILHLRVRAPNVCMSGKPYVNWVAQKCAAVIVLCIWHEILIYSCTMAISKKSISRYVVVNQLYLSHCICIESDTDVVVCGSSDGGQLLLFVHV